MRQSDPQPSSFICSTEDILATAGRLARNRIPEKDRFGPAEYKKGLNRDSLGMVLNELENLLYLTKRHASNVYLPEGFKRWAAELAICLEHHKQCEMSAHLIYRYGLSDEDLRQAGETVAKRDGLLTEEQAPDLAA